MSTPEQQAIARLKREQQERERTARESEAARKYAVQKTRYDNWTAYINTQKTLGYPDGLYVKVCAAPDNNAGIFKKTHKHVEEERIAYELEWSEAFFGGSDSGHYLIIPEFVVVYGSIGVDRRKPALRDCCLYKGVLLRNLATTWWNENTPWKN